MIDISGLELSNEQIKNLKRIITEHSVQRPNEDPLELPAAEALSFFLNNIRVSDKQEPAQNVSELKQETQRLESSGQNNKYNVDKITLFAQSIDAINKKGAMNKPEGEENSSQCCVS